MRGRGRASEIKLGDQGGVVRMEYTSRYGLGLGLGLGLGWEGRGRVSRIVNQLA